MVRLFPLQHAQATGVTKEMEAFADACMADYDIDGWTGDTWHDGSDVSVLGKVEG